MSAQGRSELYLGPDKPDGTEQSGRDLEKTAIASFMGDDDEAKRRTQEVLDKMGAAKSSVDATESFPALPSMCRNARVSCLTTAMSLPIPAGNVRRSEHGDHR